MRKLMLFALPFGAGAFLCQYCLPQLWGFWLIPAALLLGAGVWKLAEGIRLQTVLVTAGLAAGLLWFSLYSLWFLVPNDRLAGTEESVSMTLLEYACETDYGARVTVKVDGRRGRAVFYGDADLLSLEPGNRLTAAVRYYSAATLGQRESTYYTAQGVFLRLYGQGELTVEPGSAGSIRWLPQRLGKWMSGAIRGLYDQPAAGFIESLLTGERELLSEQSAADLQESGLFHITAVSGLHCGFFIALVRKLLCNRRRLTAFLGYPLLVLYAMMVGGSFSVIRACVMVGLLLLSEVVDREADAATSLSAALLLILLGNPFAIASVSLQMSFAATAGLLLVSPRMYEALRGSKTPHPGRLQRLRRALAATAAASIGSMLFTAPLSAYYFNCLSLISPLSNLLVIAAAPALFGSAFLVTLLCAAFPVLSPLACVPELLADYVLAVARLMADLPGHAVYFTGFVLMIWLLYTYGMLALCAVSREGGREYVLAAVLSLTMLALARQIPVSEVKDDALTAIAVDVGQGSAALLASDGAVALVDCGSLYSLLGPGTAVAHTVRTYGWERIDCLVLTHYHTDHAGGLEELLSRVEIGEFLLPQLDASEGQSALQQEVLALAAQYGVPVSFVEEMREVPLGRARLTLYPPLSQGNTNEEGLTALCSVGDFDLLITGDMSSSTEKRLVASWPLPDIEALVVGHHGSKASTSEKLLEAVTPEVGIISVGENNYGHPSYAAMDRMAFAGMTLYRTDLQGNILLQVHQ